MPTYVSARRAEAPRPALKLLVALMIPFVALVTVTGTYFGREIIVAALWAGVGLTAVLFASPLAGILIMTTGYMLASYPSLPQDFGVVSINNLLGVAFVILLVARVLEERDFSFLKAWPVQLYILIGLILAVSALYSDVQFPMLQVSRGKRIELDRTSEIMHEFVTRALYLVFLYVFVRTKRDIRALHYCVMAALFITVPSALINWWHGTLMAGFRAAASLKSGANPNRLAMICLIEIGCFWFWARARPTNFRKIVSAGAIAASMMVVFATGSRSGLLGTGALAILLVTGPGRYRVPIMQIAAVALLAAVAIATIVPADAWDRMINFFPERHTYGYHSSLQRLDTVRMGFQMFGDHPLLGVGPGNFREVSRQVYHDPYFRPPHNAYLWALAETGALGSAAFLALFALAWREVRIVSKLAEARDHELWGLAAALRTSIAVFSFFSLFADIWLSPIIYVLLGELIAMRRYLEGSAAAPVAHPAPLRSRLAA